MSDYLPGELLRLKELSSGLEPGWYVLVHVEDATALLAFAGEDETGDICATDRMVVTNAYNLCAFRRCGRLIGYGGGFSDSS